MKRVWTVAIALAGVASVLGAGGPSEGQQQSEEMKRMQEQLNEQVMQAPFSVPDESRVKAYIAEQQKLGVVPPPYTGRYWRPGYTCYNLARYSSGEYLACRHYHHYYGYYYR